MGVVSAELEHGEGDEGLGVLESEGEAGDQPDPAFQCLCGVGAGLEGEAEAFLEEVGAVQGRVGAGDELQLGSLVFGEVLGVLPEREPGVLQ